MLDESLGLIDQLLPIRCREHCQSPFEQLRAQGRQVGLQRPLDLVEQTAGLPLLAKGLRQSDRLLALGVPDQ